jgi:hypothetical protein
MAHSPNVLHQIEWFTRIPCYIYYNGSLCSHAKSSPLAHSFLMLYQTRWFICWITGQSSTLVPPCPFKSLYGPPRPIQKGLPTAVSCLIGVGSLCPFATSVTLVHSLQRLHRHVWFTPNVCYIRSFGSLRILVTSRALVHSAYVLHRWPWFAQGGSYI